jgi:signal transduction histidine kinase
MRINLSQKYILFTTVILLVVMGITLGVIAKRHEQLVMAQTEMQAKALFRQIVITRRWIADHGGVYVEKLPWVKPNPYLQNATIQDAAGRRYVKENPAMVTKQLSRYAQKEGLYVFHITSLKLMNRENAPDEFETRALKDFETTDAKEAWQMETVGKNRFFRYIAPLYVEQACLQCHADQGYRIGDVRGGISVSMPMDYAFAVLASDRRNMIAAGVAAAMALMLSLYFMTRRMVITPLSRMKSFMARFSRDGDPNVPLLSTGDELEDLSRSFVDMAHTLNEYHTCLQDKITAATRELTQQNEGLLRRNLRKSDYIAQLSHELRTPLTAIKGAMDYLSVKLSMRESDEDRDLLVFFETIKKNAERLMRLVTNVLDYERIELGKLEMNFREVNLKDVFQEVVTTLKPLAEAKKAAIRLKAMDVTAQVDEDRIKQVMTNLLSNALNFSPPSGKVVVTLECRNSVVQAAVEDSGGGIPEAEREMVFRQFYTKDVKGGTGLGLAICKGIIEAHDGTIGVEAAENGGSRFWFTLPKARKEGLLREKEAACRR